MNKRPLFRSLIVASKSKDHLPMVASAEPVFARMAAENQFEISDEWYEFNGNPRGRARILATADEATYQQNKPMGDHPIVWTNERYRRAIYIAIGHDPSSLTNEAYSILLRDSLLWAASAG